LPELSHQTNNTQISAADKKAYQPKTWSDCSPTAAHVVGDGRRRPTDQTGLHCLGEAAATEAVLLGLLFAAYFFGKI
jgi:hypothetical protein